ncbi:MAG: glycoside hydrolase family 43 protein [Alistipes sp.]|nr:glycoside hydrolase family 43 protein [Alistipes sp.]
MMKKLLCVAVALLAVMSVWAQKSYSGKAEDGQLLLADPFILEYDGWYYIYGTHAADGIVVYRSKDLKTWSDRCGNARNGLALHRDDVWGDRMYWAPEVYRVGDRFLMTYSCQEHICYAESDSPCGPFVQSEQRPYLPQEKGIDSSIFIDDDGKAYMFWVRFTNGNAIWVAQMSDDLRHVHLHTARHIFDAKEGTWERLMGRVVEGPMVIKLDGRYYITYSGNDFRSQDYAVGYAVADKPMGPYVRYEGNPILHRHMGYYGTGHHALFRKGKGYYMVYHAHNSGERVQTRQTLIAPLTIKRRKGECVLGVSEKIIIPRLQTK